VTAAVTVTVTVTVPATVTVTVTVPVPVSVPVPVTVKVTVTATRMSDLANSFRKSAVFDEARAKDDSKRRLEAFGKNADIFQLHVEAARFEHAYSRPLLELAAQAIEALEKVSASKDQCVYSHSDDFRKGSNVAFGQSAEVADETLAEIRSAVEGKTDE